jgi:hypothetical protein
LLRSVETRKRKRRPSARSYYTKLLELGDGSDGSRPELARAKAYLQQVNR